MTLNGWCVLCDDGEKNEKGKMKCEEMDGRVNLATQEHSEANGTSENKHSRNDE